MAVTQSGMVTTESTGRHRSSDQHGRSRYCRLTNEVSSARPTTLECDRVSIRADKPSLNEPRGYAAPSYGDCKAEEEAEWSVFARSGSGGRGGTASTRRGVA